MIRGKLDYSFEVVLFSRNRFCIIYLLYFLQWTFFFSHKETVYINQHSAWVYLKKRVVGVYKILQGLEKTATVYYSTCSTVEGKGFSSVGMKQNIYILQLYHFKEAWRLSRT